MRLRFDRTHWDAIGHGGTAYPISNSGPGIGLYEADFPDAVARIILRSSCGAVRIDEPPPDEVMHPVAMRHDDPATRFHWRGHTFAPEPDGVTLIPAAAVPDALSHGFRYIQED